MAGRVKDLYRRLGPVLYARAHRAVKDAKVAEELSKEVIIELARLGKLDDKELLKRGRARLKELCAKRGDSVVDSLVPGVD